MQRHCKNIIIESNKGHINTGWDIKHIILTTSFMALKHKIFLKIFPKVVSYQKQQIGVMLSSKYCAPQSPHTTPV